MHQDHKSFDRVNEFVLNYHSFEEFFLSLSPN
jgi:hypothetical protein